MMRAGYYRELIRLQLSKSVSSISNLGALLNGQLGFDRAPIQTLYRSKEWKLFRRDMIVRDGCCDLGIYSLEFTGLVIVHHINPITIEDIELGNPCVFDPNNAVCVSHSTHNAIHYGDKSLLTRTPD